LSFTQLDERQIIRTIEALRERIAERFPQSNLRAVCEQFLQVAKDVGRCDAYLRRPNWLLRALAAVAIVALAALVVAVFERGTVGELPLADLVQALEAAVNDIVFFGIAVYFLLTIETRVKRRKALEMLHELRSLTHIVDMHQLTKDPALLTSTSPHGLAAERTMTAAELGRYLDFCSDLLSLIAKVSALLVQHFNDGVVLAAVSEIETLTTALSGKIWQKITVLERPALTETTT
jgi:hypothetical protein